MGIEIRDLNLGFGLGIGEWDSDWKLGLGFGYLDCRSKLEIDLESRICEWDLGLVNRSVIGE